MGTVSVARLRGDRGFQRLVAVKRIRPDRRSPELITLLEREAKLAALISHPNAVRVFELAEQGPELLVVMELVEGTSLRRFADGTAERNVPLARALATHVLTESAFGLAAAHEAQDPREGIFGIVHRDVSPQNILVSFDGEVKVTDFGIAKGFKILEETQSTVVRGKPAYLSPEQARGHAVDHRSDIWSLGVVAHELFSGTRLFRGSSDLATLLRLLDEPIPRLDDAYGVPRALADAVDKCLQRDPAARYASMREFATALTEACPESRSITREDVGRAVRGAVPEEHRRLTEALRAARTMRSPERPRVARIGLHFVAGIALAGLVRGSTALFMPAPDEPPAAEMQPTPVSTPQAEPSAEASTVSPRAESALAERVPERVAPAGEPLSDEPAEAEEEVAPPRRNTKGMARMRPPRHSPAEGPRTSGAGASPRFNQEFPF